MSIAFLLDTNVVIGLLRGYAPALTVVNTHQADPDRCAISQITRMELLSFPAISATDDAVMRAAISKFAVLMLDEQIESAAIMVRRRTRLKLPDAIVLATADVHGLALLTLDDRLKAASQSIGP